MSFKERDAAHGSLSKAREQKTDKHPGYTGSLTFDKDVKAGTKLWLSGWLRDGQNGKFFSLVAQEPSKPARAVPTPAGKNADIDEEIPF